MIIRQALITDIEKIKNIADRLQVSRQKLEIESSVLKTHLKSYINDVKPFLPMPKFYEEMINER